MKYLIGCGFERKCCRTPCGVRGLKFHPVKALPRDGRSHPVRGAWIEIAPINPVPMRRGGSHPGRGAWVVMLS